MDNRKKPNPEEDDIFLTSEEVREARKKATEGLSTTGRILQNSNPNPNPTSPGVTLDLDRTALAKAINDILNEVKKISGNEVERKFYITIKDQYNNTYCLLYNSTNNNAFKLIEILENGSNVKVIFQSSKFSPDVAGFIMNRLKAETKNLSLNIINATKMTRENPAEYQNFSESPLDEKFAKTVDAKKDEILKSLKPAVKHIKVEKHSGEKLTDLPTQESEKEEPKRRSFFKRGSGPTELP